jgi:hypothetical protein
VSYTALLWICRQGLEKTLEPVDNNKIDPDTIPNITTNF